MNTKIPSSGTFIASYVETRMWPKGLTGGGFFVSPPRIKLTEYEKI